MNDQSVRDRRMNRTNEFSLKILGVEMTRYYMSVVNIIIVCSDYIQNDFTPDGVSDWKMSKLTLHPNSAIRLDMY
jgi:hypothetical protein